MKKKIVLFVFVSFLLPLRGFSTGLTDSIPSKHEFSVAYQVSSENKIDINYARRVSQNNWLKFGVNLGAQYLYNTPIINTVYPSSKLSTAVGLLVGYENHKTLKSNFEFISGLNFRVIYDINFSRVENPTWPIGIQRTTSLDFTYGLGATFGLYYKVAENFLIGSSLNPLISYGEEKNSYYNSKVVKMNLTNISVIDVKYRF